MLRVQGGLLTPPRSSRRGLGSRCRCFARVAAIRLRALWGGFAGGRTEHALLFPAAMAAISAGALAPELPQASAAPGRPLRVLISTGDVSGDLHGAALVRALLAQAKANGMPLEVGSGGGVFSTTRTYVPHTLHVLCRPSVDGSCR